MSINWGKVYLVGAGPGAPDLITLRALRCLEKADCVFYDHLVDAGLLKSAPQAKQVYVGKVGYGDQMAQTQIQEQLVQAARDHKVVVRLKGGDPFLFGRGGEEAEFLSQQGIPFEIIPGVTSALAVPAMGGIPLTHRDYSSTVAIITGHHETDKLNWEALARMETLVILMGMKNLKSNFSHLRKFHPNPKCPAAVISWGTYPFQKSVVGTLEDLPEKVATLGIKSPAVIVVGEVVRLKQGLAWFEKRPLFGKKILVTRSRSQATALREPLEALGAWVLEFPTIEIVPPQDLNPLDKACVNLKNYDWVLFSSVNGVEAFFKRFHSLDLDIRAFGTVQLAAVGPATAAALAQYGLRADLIPNEFTTDALAQTLKTSVALSEKRILFPRAEVARKEILGVLLQQGAKVDVVSAYRARVPKYSSSQLKEIFEEHPPDLLSFASSSTVKNFVELVESTPYWKAIQKIPAVVIGPVTKEPATQRGLKVVAMAQPHTVPGLIKVIGNHFLL